MRHQQHDRSAESNTIPLKPRGASSTRASSSGRWYRRWRRMLREMCVTLIEAGSASAARHLHLLRWLLLLLLVVALLVLLILRLLIEFVILLLLLLLIHVLVLLLFLL